MGKTVYYNTLPYRQYRAILDFIARLTNRCPYCKMKHMHKMSCYHRY